MEPWHIVYFALGYFLGSASLYVLKRYFQMQINFYFHRQAVALGIGYSWKPFGKHLRIQFIVWDLELTFGQGAPSADA